MELSYVVLSGIMWSVNMLDGVDLCVGDLYGVELCVKLNIQVCHMIPRRVE